MVYVFKAVKWLIRFIVSRWHPQGEGYFSSKYFLSTKGISFFTFRIGIHAIKIVLFVKGFYLCELK